jgi:hypothetical protein
MPVRPAHLLHSNAHCHGETSLRPSSNRNRYYISRGKNDYGRIGENAVRIDGLSHTELRTYLEKGWRCTRFVWCVSNITTTVERRSRVHLTENWQDRYLRGLGYSLLSLALGPWGVPWGLWRTADSILTNLTGGLDATDETVANHGGTESK